MSVISTPLPRKILHGEGFELNRSSWQASGLGGWWPLGAYPNKMDKGLYKLHGALQLLGGPPLPVPTTKGGRRCLDFANTNYFYVIGDIPGGYAGGNDRPNGWFDSSYPHTYSAWVNLASGYDSGYAIVVATTTGFSGGTGLIIHASKIMFQCNGAFGLHAGSLSLSTDTWHHVAVVYNGDQTFAMYLDGILDTGGVTSTAQTWTAASDNQLAIGAGLGVNAFDGVMDDVRIYTRGLGPNEIAAMHTETKSGYGDLAAPIKRFYNIPFSAEEPPAPDPGRTPPAEVDLVEGPSGKADVLFEMIPANLRGGRNRMTVNSGGITFANAATKSQIFFQLHQKIFFR